MIVRMHVSMHVSDPIGKDRKIVLNKIGQVTEEAGTRKDVNISGFIETFYCILAYSLFKMYF